MKTNLCTRTTLISFIEEHIILHYTVHWMQSVLEINSFAVTSSQTALKTLVNIIFVVIITAIVIDSDSDVDPAISE